ncbi:MAG TPA: PAS domain-containing sensor histidine kinase, partial [Rhizobiales bacterium]|nr:PAS domain-containing sensor histidine kinase [Hyphomicrobiales bacterium]
TSHPEIGFEVKLPDEPAETLCDRRLITQAVTNLVKNASEAIEAMGENPHKRDGYRGQIFVRLRAGEGTFMVEVIDNGIGLPQENRNRLVEPYMTTREKGTGLGLAIVKKITEQHQGALVLEDASSAKCPEFRGRLEHGACVRLTIPARNRSAAQAAGESSGESGELEEAAQ